MYAIMVIICAGVWLFDLRPAPTFGQGQLIASNKYYVIKDTVGSTGHSRHMQDTLAYAPQQELLYNCQAVSMQES